VVRRPARLYARMRIEPVATAMAWMVSVEATAIAPVHWVEPIVGVVPLVVW
jgi:hypothetical protein